MTRFKWLNYCFGLAGFLLIFLSSCTIQKRLYRPGFNLEWSKRKPANYSAPVAKNSASANKINAGRVSPGATEEQHTTAAKVAGFFNKHDKLTNKVTLLIRRYPFGKSPSLPPLNFKAKNENKKFEIHSPVLTLYKSTEEPVAEDNSAYSKKAITGFVLGLIGLLTCWTVITGLILGILGIVFSILGLGQTNKNNKNHEKGNGYAIAGLTLSILAIIGSILTILLIIALINFFEEANMGLI